MAESIQTKLKHILEPIFWVGLISCGLYFFWSTGPHFGSTQTLYLSQDVALNEYRYRILQQFSFRANLFTGEVAILREEPKVGAGVRRVPMHVLAPSFESNASVIKDPWNSLMRIEDY